MMDVNLLRIGIAAETDIVLVRNRTRRLAELLGFDTQDQTRIATAVSEIVRNAFEYAGGGQAEFRLAGEPPAQRLEIAIGDRGPGISDLEAILSGAQRSTTGMGAGLAGARRLMDVFELNSSNAGTTVRLGKGLPRRAPHLTPATLERITDTLASEGPAEPLAEIARQNQEIMLHLQELQTRHEDLQRINRELQDTNRGVVALYAELDERADHLRRADELKSKFLSHMSHEFRTPLNSILALSRLLLARGDGELNPEQEKQVGFILRAAEDLTGLIDDLLDLARVEAGKTVVAPASFTVSSLFGTLRGMLRPLLVGDAVALVFDDPGEMPPLDTDESKVSQILRNFISNAIKFTEHGEVRVSAAHDPLADTISLQVRDTGIGIAASDIPIIFQEFGQVAHRLQGRAKGTGLGLPLAKKLAELLGGRITVESTPNSGSTFVVTLPRIYRAAAAGDADADWIVQEGRAPVLLLEDDPADALAVELLLTGTVYQPLRARSVREAKRLLQSIRPDAILLDVLLQGDESWRLLMKLRSQEATAEIPIVVVSATGEAHKALHLGADAYLAKPLDAESLIDALDRVTGRHTLTHVLLVDDEEATGYLVRQLLPRAQYRLSVSRDGASALKCLAEHRPDVVLFGLSRPGTTELAALAHPGPDNGRAEPPVIVLAPANGARKPGGAIPGAALSLAKSDLTPGGLIDAIEQVLGARTIVGKA